MEAHRGSSEELCSYKSLTLQHTKCRDGCTALVKTRKDLSKGAKITQGMVIVSTFLNFLTCYLLCKVERLVLSSENCDNAMEISHVKCTEPDTE